MVASETSLSSLASRRQIRINITIDISRGKHYTPANFSFLDMRVYLSTEGNHGTDPLYAGRKG